MKEVKHKTIEQGSYAIKCLYFGMKSGDIGEVIPLDGVSNPCIQVEGSFSKARLAIQGSVGEKYFTLEDSRGMPLEFNDEGLKSAADSVSAIRPIVIGGDENTELNVFVKMNK